MSKALEFKKRQEKDTAVKANQASNDIAMFRQAIGKIFQMVAQIEQRLEQSTASAKIADWRSLATLKVLDDASKGKISHGHINEATITAKAEELQIEAFNRESATDDAARKLEPAEGPAENGLFAIARLRLFSKGEEVQDSQVLRTKFEIGKAELLPQVDEAVIGMKAGETKRFPLALAGRTDEAELYLIDLRKAPAAAAAPTVEAAPAAEATPAGQGANEKDENQSS